MGVSGASGPWNTSLRWIGGAMDPRAGLDSLRRDLLAVQAHAADRCTNCILDGIFRFSDRFSNFSTRSHLQVGNQTKNRPSRSGRLCRRCCSGFTVQPAAPLSCCQAPPPNMRVPPRAAALLNFYLDKSRIVAPAKGFDQTTLRTKLLQCLRSNQTSAGRRRDLSDFGNRADDGWIGQCRSPPVAAL